jgi:chaperone modulatory protein CbpM
MEKSNVLTGELLDEVTFTLDELARACSVEPQWIMERVEAGIIHGELKQSATWCFASADLVRARRLISIEKGFDADPELAAMVTDLIEEVNSLKHRLKVAGFIEN